MIDIRMNLLQLGTYAYSRISFGPKNARATFQGAMDYTFKEMIGKIKVDYQDELTIYSKLRTSH